MAVINKDLAESIAKKLGASIKRKKGSHDIARVYHKGKLIGSFGIRRSSKGGTGHDYIPGQIYVSTHEALLLGQCPLKVSDYYEILRKKGLIE